MIGQLLLFLACLVCGAVLRGLYFLMRIVQKRTGILAVSIVFDCIYGVVFFAPLFLLAAFYNDGAITVYMAAAQAVGFLLAKLLF